MTKLNLRPQFFSGVILFGWALGCFTSAAQSSGADVILSAMRDELKHNMDCLSLKGHERPFYISYGMDDVRTHQFIAILGSLYYAGSDQFRSKSVRVLAGDYEFNDESLESAGGFNGESHDIELPIQDDYNGIRRAYWSATDQVYKGAARAYARNKETLSEQKKPLQEIPHRSFAKANPTQLVRTYTPFEFVSTEWENYVKEISMAVQDFEDIENSMVYLTFQQGYRYFVSSEGTIIKTPLQEARLQISVQNSSDAGDIAADEITFYARLPSGLPSTDQAKDDAHHLAEKISNAISLPTLKEEYSGPVLFEGDGVPQILMNALFAGRETLRSHNMVPSLSGLQFDLPGSMETKMDKQILPPTFTVRAYGNLTSWNGVELMGHFDADDEGVVPPDTLTLVEDGILKNIFQDRTVTNTGFTSNGYSNKMGVLEVLIENTASHASMKQNLLELAKEQGLEYAYLVRESPDAMASTTVIRINVATGEEQPLRNADFEAPSMRELRNIVAASKEQQVQHINSDVGGLSSWITPRALLFDDVTLLPANVPVFKEINYVTRPR